MLKWLQRNASLPNFLLLVVHLQRLHELKWAPKMPGVGRPEGPLSAPPSSQQLQLAFLFLFPLIANDVRVVLYTTFYHFLHVRICFPSLSY